MELNLLMKSHEYVYLPLKIGDFITKYILRNNKIPKIIIKTQITSNY